MSTQSQIEAKLAAKLRKKNKGVHSKIKDHEAHAGGRQLPPDLEDAVLQITELRMGEDKNGKAYVMSFNTVVEPVEFAGISENRFYSLEDQTFPSGDKVTAAENIERFYNDMKLTGFDEEVRKSDDEFDVYLHIKEWLKDKSNKRYWLANTRKKRTGGVSVFVQDCCADDYQAPVDTESKQEGYEPVDTTAESNGQFSIGDEIETDKDLYGDDTVYKGRITDLSTDSATIEFEDGQSQDVEFSMLTLINAEPSTNGDSSSQEDWVPVKGDMVTTTDDYFEDGVDYKGVVASINGRKKEATIEFEDESSDSVPFEYLSQAE